MFPWGQCPLHRAPKPPADARRPARPPASGQASRTCVSCFGRCRRLGHQTREHVRPHVEVGDQPQSHGPHAAAGRTFRAGLSPPSPAAASPSSPLPAAAFGSGRSSPEIPQHRPFQAAACAREDPTTRWLSPWLPDRKSAPVRLSSLASGRFYHSARAGSLQEIQGYHKSSWCLGPILLSWLWRFSRFSRSV